ncbi:MAG TPA: hypothetical protein VE596_13385 [Gaiellaceae bacterium]|nr:hypothetical protein [Gaiellaceae bacterium]
MDAASKRQIAFGAGLVAGVPAPAHLHSRLARENRLFLRDSAAIARNRDRIGRFGIWLGWILGVVFVAAAVSFGGVSRIVFLCVLAGAGLGFWPGLVANFLRLRREGWSANRR